MLNCRSSAQNGEFWRAPILEVLCWAAKVNNIWGKDNCHQSGSGEHTPPLDGYAPPQVQDDPVQDELIQAAINLSMDAPEGMAT